MTKRFKLCQTYKTNRLNAQIKILFRTKSTSQISELTQANKRNTKTLTAQISPKIEIPISYYHKLKMP